jgi:threonine/homoserine/homoserine lactone efflux protein
VAFEPWLLFCVTETVLCFTPGPAVLFVISLSLARGAGAGLRGSLGILTANVLYFATSATGLGVILLASWDLFVVVKWLGAAYLVWLGARMLFVPVASTGGAAATPRRSHLRPYVSGFVTQGANPKAIVFFSAILPQFVDPAASVPRQVAILGVSSVLIELTVLSLYVVACHQARRWARQPRYATALERVGGAFLVAAGARLAVLRRA